MAFDRCLNYLEFNLCRYHKQCKKTKNFDRSSKTCMGGGGDYCGIYNKLSEKEAKKVGQ